MGGGSKRGGSISSGRTNGAGAAPFPIVYDVGENVAYVVDVGVVDVGEKGKGNVDTVVVGGGAPCVSRWRG